MSAKGKPFYRIGIFVKSDEERVNRTPVELMELLSSQQTEIHFVGRPPVGLNLKDIHPIEEERIGECCDLLLVIGGDGSFLRFAKSAAHHGVPMLGINRGRVGFLTELATQDMLQELPRILQGDCIRSNAMLLEGSLLRDGKILCVHKGFNDLVVHSRSGRMLDLSILIDGRFVYAERSDGLIAATPSGSTAYALSAGGPIITPKVEAISLINISPRTLSHRPLVLSNSSQITIEVEDGKSIAFYADGWGEQKTLPGDKIEIQVAKERVPLIHPRNYDFFAACRQKLGWHTHAKPKPA